MRNSKILKKYYAEQNKAKKNVKIREGAKMLIFGASKPGGGLDPYL